MVTVARSRRIAEKVPLSSTPTDRYLARFRRVFDFIDAHADEDLCLDRLSGIAAFSKFHFQRQFSDSFGISVHKYVRLVRLKRASYALAFRDDSRIVDIALDSGYDGPESFARAFRKNTGQSPLGVQETTAVDSVACNVRTTGRTEEQVHETEPSDRCRFRSSISKRRTWRRSNIAAIRNCWANSVRTFIDWRRQNGLPPGASKTFNVVYAHPLDGGDCALRIVRVDRPAG